MVVMMMIIMMIILMIIVFDKCVTAQNLSTTIAFNVGVILDLNSSAGKMALSCISMAVSDFYGANSFYKTRLVLHPRDSMNDNIGAASAALDLLKNMEVRAIIGPETSAQINFVADIGNKAQVPIISFSASSPSLSSFRSPYLIRTSENDSFQVKAIKAVVQAFAWREIITIYEDTYFGNGIIPYLYDSFQEIDTRLPYKSIIYPFATDSEISKELDKLIKMQTRVFIVHMNPSLGSRLFLMAKAKGMMTEGYCWIITDSMTNHLSSLDSSVIESMQGVLGVSPYVPKSKELDSFRVKWKKKYLQENLDLERAQPSIYDLWAYDTVWALAMAAEEVGSMNNSLPFHNPKFIDNSSDLAMLGVSQIGLKLSQTIRQTRFKGLSGNFHLVDGQLQSKIFQILNVIGNGGRKVGFWTSKKGLLRRLKSNNSSVYSSSISNLSGIIWPGESINVPKGWAVVTNGRKLRIGVPVKGAFNEFVKVELDPKTNLANVTGYSIDVFNAIMKTLPYTVPYEFVTCAQCKNYNEVVQEVYLKNFDAVVGDISILPNRSLYVDFTSPYTESGMSMIVPIIKDDKKNWWIFLKPLPKEMWLSTLAAFIFTGFVVWVFEHRINKNFRGSPSEQLGMIFWFSFSTIVFAHKEKVRSNLSRFVLIIWVFVVLILTSSYTASLTSTLTVQQLTVSDINQLIRNGEYVGYQQASYVKDILKRLHFDESKLRSYDSLHEYADALSKGSQKGGVAAVFDEIPYLKLFLSKYCDKYAMVGPTYNTNGFGFVFRKGSPLLLDVSKAISNRAGQDKIMEIDLKWFRNKTSCQDPGSSVSLDSLTIESFRGLFLTTVATSTCALFIFLGSFIYKHMHILTNSVGSEENGSITQRVVTLAKRFYESEECPSCSTSKRMTELENQEMQVMDSPSNSSLQTTYLYTQNIEENGITSNDELDNSSDMLDSRKNIEISSIE